MKKYIIILIVLIVLIGIVYAQPITPSGVRFFVLLYDTPTTFTDQAGKGLRVNSSADALEFFAWANSTTLGTDTTGNYVATIAGNNVITVTGSGSENAAITLDITDNVITEADLKAVDSATDEDFLTYESTTGDFEWHSVADISALIAADIAEGELANSIIISADIKDGVIAEADLKIVDSATDEDIFTYESTTGDFEWHTIAQILATTDTDSLSEGSSNLYASTEEEIEDFVGGMLGGTETDIAVTYQDATNDIDFVVTSDVDIVTTSPLTVNAGANLDDVLLGSDADITLAITVLKDLVTTAPVTGGTNDIFPGADADITVALDFTAAWDFGSAAGSEWVNDGTPTTDAAGEVALDTTITDHQPLWQYYDGGENMTVIAIDTAQLPAQDNEIVKYDAGSDKFILEADADTGGATAWDDITDPDAAATVDFVTYTQTIDIGVTDTGGPKSGLILDVTGLGAGTTDVIALEITTATNDDTDYIPIAVYDDSGGDNDLLFKVDSYGSVYVYGTDSAIRFALGAIIQQASDNSIRFKENSDQVEFVFLGTDLGLVWDDGALNLRNDEDGVDAIVEIEGKDAGEKGILRVLSDGDDKHIELHHDDTDAQISSSSGDIYFTSAGGDINFNDDNLTTTGSATTATLILTGADASPSAAGNVKYDSTVAGMSGGALRWYDDNSVRLIVDLETDPSNDDYVVAYDAAADGFYMLSAGAGDMLRSTYDSGESGGVDVLTTVDSTYASDYVLLTGTAVGTAAPKTDGALTYDATSGTIAAIEFSGGGANLTAVDAATGDSATAFFDAGTIEHEWGGLQADISGYTGLIAITGVDTTAEIDSLDELEGQLADVTLIYTEAIIPAAGTDPDVDATGEFSIDTDGANEPNDVVLRTIDGNGTQIALAQEQKSFQATIITPNDLANATRDLCPIWSNETGMSFVITKIEAWSDTDDTTVNVEVYDSTFGNNATVDALEIAGDGTANYYVTETTITAATILANYIIVLDFDDTDDPGWVKISICGYFLSDVN